MTADDKHSPLFLLHYVKNEGDEIYYRITSECEVPDEAGQRLSFNSVNYSINFIAPYSQYYQYLFENEKWLRSILCTTLKIGDPETIEIPFSFPEERPLSEPPENSVRVYCDGSCGDTGNGGWGGVIIFPGEGPVEISGYEQGTTSNRMELAAAVGTLLKAEELMLNSPRTVILCTDSHYVIHGITHRLQVWRRNGFITALGTPVLNRELWEKLDSVIGRVEVHCVKVDAADNDPHHSRCDEIAGIRMRQNRL